MNADEPDSKPRRAVSSVEVSMLGGATLEVANCPIVLSASSVFFSSSATLSGPLRNEVPAAVIMALAHTTRPSYLLAWTWIWPLPGPSFWAICSVCAHVLGACGTRSLRYHSSWVLDQIGTA